MFNRKLLLIPAAALLLLAACNDDDQPQSVVSVVNGEIANNTTESAVPIFINDLPLDEAGTDETSSPSPI